MDRQFTTDVCHSGSVSGQLRDRRRYVESMNRAEHIVAVSQPLFEFLIDSAGHSGQPGIDNWTISCPRGPRSLGPRTRIPAFFASHEPVVMGVGAAIPLYEVRTLTSAFSRLRGSCARAGLVLLNSTFDRDDAYAGGTQGRHRFTRGRDVRCWWMSRRASCDR